MAREHLEFQNWQSELTFNNDADAVDQSFTSSQQYLYQKLTGLYKQLGIINDDFEKDPEKNSDDVYFSLNQLNAILDHLLTTYQKSKHVKILSANICKLFARTISLNLNIMMKNGHEKFNISLIELVNKLNDLIISDVKKLSMSKNWYTSLKHLSMIVLQSIFTKFSGFLTTFKNQLVTALYKYLSKANDSYNSSIENNLFMSNYFSDMVHLIAIILAHDNSNSVLDDKLLSRLFKLVKFVNQKNNSSASSVFTYPLISVSYSFSILISLLKSDKFISTLNTNKKVSINLTKYLAAIKDYVSLFFETMEVDHKKLKLTVTKNFADLLVFIFIVFGSNTNQTDFALDSCISLLLSHYRLKSTSSNLKSGIIETLIQFISKLNLYYQTNRVQTSKIPDNINFVAFKFFDILDIIYSNIFEFATNLKEKKKKKDDHDYILINNSISLNFAIKTLNHMNLIHQFLLKELDNDSNSLICLSKIVFGNTSDEKNLKIKCLNEVLESNENFWYAANLLNFSQLVVDSLNEFVLSNTGATSGTHDMQNTDAASQLVQTFTKLTHHPNNIIRNSSVETLIKLLRIKPELSLEILNKSFGKIVSSFNNDANDDENSFNDNYANAYLIASIVSFSSKTFITHDFILEVFTLLLDYLKKFNTSLVSNNLFGSNSGIKISNIEYEKQVVSWILLLGLFNHSTNENPQSNNLFLQDSNQFLSIWKNLLAHSLPAGFIRIDSKTKSILNLNEIIKIIQIKNQSLICLIAYISYLSGNGHLNNDEAFRQLNQLLAKSHLFISSLTNELNSVPIPKILETTISTNRLRIYQSYLKLLPQLKVKNEIASSMLLEIVKNFTDVDKFNDSFQDPYGRFIKMSKKKHQIHSYTEYSIYDIEDGSCFGLSTKFNNFEIDELVLSKSLSDGRYDSNPNFKFFPYGSNSSVELSPAPSYLTNLSVFDDTTESRGFKILSNSLLNDPFILLYTNSFGSGYADAQKYPPPLDLSAIDSSIELFKLAFPYLSSKVQLSVLEAMRSSIFYKSKEGGVNGDENTDESKLKKELSLILRKKAISINSSIAIHSVLVYMHTINSHEAGKLYLKSDVAAAIVETLKNMSFEDVYLVNLNSESIGICYSLIEDASTKDELVKNQVTILINAIIENSNPNFRAFAIKILSNLTKFTEFANTTDIKETLFTLLVDPHPIVHAASLYSLDIFINRKSNREISDQFIFEVLNYIERIWLSDDFGIRSKTTISSNINFREHSNSVNLIVKILRSVTNLAGPTIRLWEMEKKVQLSNILYNLQSLVVFDYEILSRELLKIYEELLVFDNESTILNISTFKKFTKMLIVNNFKIGVCGHSLSNLPFDDDYDNENTIEVFPCTTSFKLLNSALESSFQLFKMSKDQLIDPDFERLLWIALEANPNNESIKTIVRILMQDAMNNDVDQRFLCFVKILQYFNISKTEITKPLMSIFEKRINKGGMYFHIPANFTKNPKLSNDIVHNPVNVKHDDLEEEINEAQETLTSDQIKEVNDMADGDDDEDSADVNSHRNGANFNEPYANVNLLDLSNEQINWKFKLFLIEILNHLLTFCEIDEKLKIQVSKKITEFIRIAFVSSTTNLTTLRIASLKLLGKIIELYSDMKDPLYPDYCILDQQQAQIMSAITPSFTKGSSIELAGEALLLSSKFICSNVTDIKKVNRIIKILCSSIEDLSINEKKPKTDLKIGEILILTKKAENRIKIYVLQSWSKLLILNETSGNSSEELQIFIDTYISILIPMWIQSIREYSMLKYNTSYFNEGVDIQFYENELCWIDFVDTVSFIIDNDAYYGYLVELLGDETGKLYMMIFGLCFEYLIKRSSQSPKDNDKFNNQDNRILKCLSKIMSLDISSKILFNDFIFAEFIDILNKWIVITKNTQTQSNIILLAQSIFVNYFKSSNCNNEDTETKPIEEIYKDFDKLFELLRLNTKILITKLPFLKDKQVDCHNYQLELADLVLVKRAFSSLLEMTDYLPQPIKVDLNLNFLYMIILIHELNNEKLLLFLISVLQKVLVNLELNDPTNENLTNIFKIFNLNQNRKEDKLICFIILKHLKALEIDMDDTKLINTMLTESLSSDDSNLMAISVQTIKSVIEDMNESKSSKKIIKVLIPNLIKMASSEEKETLKEPRLIIEILVLISKKFLDEKSIKVYYKILLPILVYFFKTYPNFDQYINGKFIELIELNPVAFKSIIEVSDNELKNEIQNIVSFKNRDDLSETAEASQSHIELRTFG